MSRVLLSQINRRKSGLACRGYRLQDPPCMANWWAIPTGVFLVGHGGSLRFATRTQHIKYGARAAQSNSVSAMKENNLLVPATRFERVEANSASTSGERRVSQSPVLYTAWLLDARCSIRRWVLCNTIVSPEATTRESLLVEDPRLCFCRFVIMVIGMMNQLQNRQPSIGF
jgi:hypothetical protein